jgi:Ser/Thr protein kinase RdoA (MazF antagonist)
MSALQAAGIEVPTVVPALDGRLFVKAQLHAEPGARQVDLFEWIDGRQLGSSEGGLASGLADVEAIYRKVGSLMAGLHNQAAAWPLPGGFQRHHWDLEGLVGEQPLWGRFWELAALAEDQRELLLRARERVRRELIALAGSADAKRCHGLIHADLVPENLLLPADGRLRLIDFDDAGFGWHGFELATALYFLQDDARYAMIKAALIEGYRSQRSLPDADLERLPMFLAARSFTYLGWVHTRPMSNESAAITPLLIRVACRQAERLLDT